jgi:hypothetical protein
LYAGIGKNCLALVGKMVSPLFAAGERRKMPPAGVMMLCLCSVRLIFFWVNDLNFAGEYQ